jgi:hypothetical protein
MRVQEVLVAVHLELVQVLLVQQHKVLLVEELVMEIMVVAVEALHLELHFMAAAEVVAPVVLVQLLTILEAQQIQHQLQVWLVV